MSDRAINFTAMSLLYLLFAALAFAVVPAANYTYALVALAGAICGYGIGFAGEKLTQWVKPKLADLLS